MRNDDDVAQVKLGSLRTFHEYQYTATSSAGALTIDKNNAQVQYVDVTENITSINHNNESKSMTSETSNEVPKTDIVESAKTVEAPKVEVAPVVEAPVKKPRKPRAKKITPKKAK